MSSENHNKEIFYKDSMAFFEAGLLKEIYSSDELCICNIANQCYGVFPYVKTPSGQSCLLIIPKHVKEIIENPSFLTMLVNSLDHKTLVSRSIALNNKTFKLMEEMKKRNDINGPTKDIDFEMEEELMAKNKSR